MRDEPSAGRRASLSMGLGLQVGAAAILAVAVTTPLAARAQDPQGAPPLPYLLRLQPGQAEAWRAYRDELALERVDGAEAAVEAGQLNAMTTPQRIDHQLAQLPRQEAQMRRQAQAVRAFYAQLSPDQRRMFDRVTRAPTPPPLDESRRAQAGERRPQLPQPPSGAPLPLPGE